MWNVETGEPVGKLMRHDEAVSRVAFSPDGTRVVTASADKTARVWDVETSAPIGEPMRHLAWVYCAAFSPDGRCVVTGSHDNTARLWDVMTGAPIGGTMRNVRGGIWGVDFSPDGKRLALGCYNLACFADVERPNLGEVPPPTLQGTLELCTGYRAAADGTLRELNLAEIEDIRRRLGDEDPLVNFVAEIEKSVAAARTQRQELFDP